MYCSDKKNGLKVLIVKMSSMGDVVHCLPALNDAVKARKEVTFDWVVEENFSPVVKVSPYVDRVIEIGMRRWRRNLLSPSVWKEMRSFRRRLRERNYDLIVDAQGLIKSAIVAWLAKGIVKGFDSRSARESIASLFYQEKYTVSKDMHAIDRIRKLFALSLGYGIELKTTDIGLNDRQDKKLKNVIFIHGTTWKSKEWPLEYWKELSKLAKQDGFDPIVTWGNLREKARCEDIKRSVPDISILPKMPLADLIQLLGKMSGVVTVDTGLGHLAAAMDIPTVAVFGSTDESLTGVRGSKSLLISDREIECRPCRSRSCRISSSLCSGKVYPPCYEKISPEKVWRELTNQINKTDLVSDL